MLPLFPPRPGQPRYGARQKNSNLIVCTLRMDRRCLASVKAKFYAVGVKREHVPPSCFFLHPNVTGPPLDMYSSVHVLDVACRCCTKRIIIITILVVLWFYDLPSVVSLPPLLLPFFEYIQTSSAHAVVRS